MSITECGKELTTREKTTLTDNLMAGAGMLAEEMAGKVMFTWFDPEERKRQLTVYGANVSMVHEYEGRDFLINLLDTPGHVDRLFEPDNLAGMSLER